MKLVTVSDLFNVSYGVNLALNALSKDTTGINFVSRTARNNGVSARVEILDELEPIPAGTISVACGGSVMESFLQPAPYYSGRDIYYLSPKEDFTVQEKLFYCMCLRANACRFNYGRQANKFLKHLRIPARSEIPGWVISTDIGNYNKKIKKNRVSVDIPELQTSSWKHFRLEKLFEIKKGKRIVNSQTKPGSTPLIRPLSHSNGYASFIGEKPNHRGNTITVNYNSQGGVAYAFYQPVDFFATDDVNVLYPRFELNSEIALFIVTLIKNERYRFNYGRKWHLERMKQSLIKLPVTSSDEPDWEFMENYIKSLPYSQGVR